MTYMYIHEHSVDSLIISTKTLFANIVIVVYSLHFSFLSTFLSFSSSLYYNFCFL